MRINEIIYSVIKVYKDLILLLNDFSLKIIYKLI